MKNECNQVRSQRGEILGLVAFNFKVPCPLTAYSS